MSTPAAADSLRVPTGPLTDAARQQLLDDYHWLHEHPELSMQEHATARFIEQRLQQLGVRHFRCGGTGVVGILHNGPGPVAGFRADMDGLPIREQTELPYRSTATATTEDGTQVPVMHGCGHDGHTAMALAAVAHLQRLQDSWSGTAVFIFQPGEETAAGAGAMVSDGLWDKAPIPQALFAQHLTPMPAGTATITPGPAFSTADSLKVTVRGHQAHGSQPHLSIDPVMLAAHMVVRLQSIVAREVPPQESAVITVGTIHAGLKENIIPDLAQFTINVRTFLPEVRTRVLASIRRVVSGEAMISGAPEPLVEELGGFPPCVNDPELSSRLLQVLAAELGAQQVRETPAGMASEDFGNLVEGRAVPTVYWRLGAYTAEQISAGQAPGNHSPHFAPDPQAALEPGVRAATAALLSVLRTGRQ